MNYLGIDIGSSRCKAVVFDSNGNQLAIANRAYDVIFSSDGGAELNPDEVIEKCFEVIKECTAKVEANSIIGMGISSQGEAFTAIDKHGKTLCNAMISSDTRAESYVHSWANQFGKENLYQITGHTPHPMFTVFKLLWLKENKQRVWKNTKKFLCFEDLLQYRLGLDPAIGYSLAGRTMMFDVRKNEWSSEILKSLEITPKQLAKPLPSGTIVGYLEPKLCQTLGFSDNAFVVAGGHDQPCGALGSGITEPGLGIYATGTVECITSASTSPMFSKNLYKNNLCTYSHVVNNMYVTIAYNLTGGNILKWFRNEFGYKEMIQAEKTGIDVYQLLLEKAGKKPSNLLVLPYFTASGTPYFDTKTKGAILGLQLATTRGEIIRSLLEGIAFEMRLNIEILEKSGCFIKELRTIGGGAKSTIWTQLKADVIGKKITTLNVTEAGCLGIAMLACSTHTNEPIQKLVTKWIRPESTIIPQSDNKKWYNKQFEQYKKLYALIKQVEI